MDSVEISCWLLGCCLHGPLLIQNTQKRNTSSGGNNVESFARDGYKKKKQNNRLKVPGRSYYSLKREILWVLCKEVQYILVHLLLSHFLANSVGTIWT